MQELNSFEAFVGWSSLVFAVLATSWLLIVYEDSRKQFRYWHDILIPQWEAIITTSKMFELVDGMDHPNVYCFITDTLIPNLRTAGVGMPVVAKIENTADAINILKQCETSWLKVAKDFNGKSFYLEMWDAIHNVLAHPLHQVIWWFSGFGYIKPMCRLSEWIHDSTVP